MGGQDAAKGNPVPGHSLPYGGSRRDNSPNGDSYRGKRDSHPRLRNAVPGTNGRGSLVTQYHWSGYNRAIISASAGATGVGILILAIAEYVR